MQLGGWSVVSSGGDDWWADQLSVHYRLLAIGCSKLRTNSQWLANEQLSILIDYKWIKSHTNY